MIKIDLDNDKQVNYICDYFKNEALENKIEEKDLEIGRLNNIINKAIEFIENTRHTTSMTLEEMCDLEDILKGVDKE